MTLGEAFTNLRARGELAFVPYQTAGYPTLDESIANAKTLAALGADILEFGVPFSDPMADGPTIQYSSQVALENGVTLEMVLDRLAADPLPLPVVLMSYLNPLLAHDRAALFDKLRCAGVAGLIVPDLPVEESEDWLADGRKHGIDLIFLLAPTNSDERIRKIAARAAGFIYAVAVIGTTGARESLYDGLPAFLERIRAVSDLPIVVGFGISRPEHVRALHGQVDGVIVASRLIDAIRRGDDWKPLAASLKAATRR
jgi:tryptophan synthase alpha chain